MYEVMKFQEMSNITIDVKPHHLFRYPSEWDPRQNGKTKGGYLEGKIQLPRDVGNLRVLISTHPETPHQFKEAQIEENPNSLGIHPTLIHVVRKGKGNRRFNDKEPVPNIHHWQQEFVIINKNVFIRNKTSEMDEPRYDKIERIEPEDEMFPIQDDFILPIGKEFGELNMIILIPKTEKRASHDDVCLSKLLKSRVKDPLALKFLTDTYTGKNSLNLKKVKLRVDVFSLESNIFIGSSISGPIFDTASKAHGAMDLHDATPLRSCAMGGRKIVMIAEFGLAKDVEPRFQLYNSEGKRLKEEEEKVLMQPNIQQGKSVSIMKETIVFITPHQPNAEMILENQWRVKLVARRSSDGLVSKTKFDFDIVPHDFYSTCIFCEIDPDKQALGQATIAPMRDVARPGLRKRQMSGTEIRDFSETPNNMTEDTSQPEAKKQKNNSDRNVKISQPLSNSAVYTVQSPTVIQSLPKLAISSPTTPLTRPLLNSLTLPSTVTYLSFPLTTNGHLVPTLASLPRIAPKPTESLLATPKTTNQNTGSSHLTNIFTNQNTGSSNVTNILTNQNTGSSNVTNILTNQNTGSSHMTNILTNQNTGTNHLTNILTNENTPTTAQHIKTESEEEQSVEKNVPMYDFNKSHTVRMFPVNLGGQTQDSSIIFPSTEGGKTKEEKQ